MSDSDKMLAEFEAWAKMNVDEAMAIADGYCGWMSNGRIEVKTSEIVAITLSKEVERLRAELAAAKAELQNIVSGQIKANGWEDCE